MKTSFLIISRGWAGAENALYYLLNSFVKLDNKTILFTNEEMVKYYNNIKDLKIISLGNAFKCNKFYSYFKLFKFSKDILNKIKTENISILIIFMEDAISVCSKMGSKLKIPCLVSLRGSEMDFYKRNSLIKKIRYPHLYFPLKNMLKRCQKIHSHNNWQIKNLGENLREKCVIIPNGVESNVFRPLSNIKQKKNVILFTGRYLAWKGIREILKVAKQLPQYEFWFAGKGELEKEIKGKNVKNFGFKSTQDLVRLYNQATICIFPSWDEPFGNTAREAMACQRTVIVTPKGFSETVENNKDGIIIPAKDEKALKDAIVDLMTNEKKRKILEKNARKKALQYSWENVAKQYMKVFKEVLKESEKKK